MENQKQYPDRIQVEGVIVRAKPMKGGQDIIKVSINIEKFKEMCNKHQEGGWIKMDFFPRREVSEKGITHHVNLDTWKPDPNYRKNDNDRNYSPPPDRQEQRPHRGDDNVPF